MPELLDGTNHVAWWQAGATIFDKKGIQYLGVPGLINAKSIIATLLVQVSSTPFGCMSLCGVFGSSSALDMLHAAAFPAIHCCQCVPGTL